MVAALIDDAQRLPKRHSRRSSHSSSNESSPGGPPSHALHGTLTTPEEESKKTPPKLPFGIPPFQLPQKSPETPENNTPVDEKPFEHPSKYPFGQEPFQSPAAPQTPESPSAAGKPNKTKAVKLPFGGKEPFKLEKTPSTSRTSSISKRSPTKKPSASATSAVSATTSDGGGSTLSSSAMIAGRSGSITSQRSSTVPVPFNLSSSRWKAKGPAGAPQPADALRRVPALISMRNELEKGSEVVREAVGWEERPTYRPIMADATRILPPGDVATITFDSIDEMMS